MNRNLQDRIYGARLLIVDDEPANVVLLDRLLSDAGYTDILTTTDSREVMPLCEARPPDLVLLDLMMPYIDGFGIMQQLQTQFVSESYLPVLVLTADATPATKLRALSAGAKDFLVKPFDANEVRLRVRNLLETRILYCELQVANQGLEARVNERTVELQQANVQLEEANWRLLESQLEVIERLGAAAEFRDDQTGAHTQRVGDLAALLAKELGLEPATIGLIQLAAPLHDVGKIAISDTILLKPGKLTPEEFDTIKTHAEIGGRLLAHGKSPLMRLAQVIAVSHHERWDGRGYPLGLAGDAIPIAGRILAVVDVFDALTNERPYKPAWPVSEALAEIEKNAGTQFDPEVAAAFLRLMRRAQSAT